MLRVKDHLESLKSCPISKSNRLRLDLRFSHHSCFGNLTMQRREVTGKGSRSSSFRVRVILVLVPGRKVRRGLGGSVVGGAR